MIFLGRDVDSVHGHPELPIQLLRVQCACLEMTQTYYEWCSNGRHLMEPHSSDMSDEEMAHSAASKAEI